MATNATLTDEEALLLLQCEAARGAGHVHLAFAPLWLLLLCVWAHSFLVRHRRHGNDLHCLLTVVPAFVLLHSLLAASSYAFCPASTPFQRVLSSLSAIASIVKEPIIIVCLLMVAKGWCTTRDELEPRENRASAVLVVFLYVSIVAHFSSDVPGAVVPMLVAWFLMLLNVAGSVTVNLRVLKAQLLALRSFNVDATSTPAFAKYRMFRGLGLAVAAYYVADLALFLVQWRKLVPAATSALLRHVLEALTSVCIGYVFRARPLSPVFEQMGSEQVQAIVERLAADLLPQISTVVLDMDALRGEGTVPWSREMDAAALGEAAARAPPPDMLVVVNPHELLGGDCAGEGGGGDGGATGGVVDANASADAEAGSSMADRADATAPPSAVAATAAFVVAIRLDSNTETDGDPSSSSPSYASGGGSDGAARLVDANGRSPTAMAPPRRGAARTLCAAFAAMRQSLGGAVPAVPSTSTTASSSCGNATVTTASLSSCSAGNAQMNAPGGALSADPLALPPPPDRLPPPPTAHRLRGSTELTSWSSPGGRGDSVGTPPPSAVLSTEAREAAMNVSSSRALDAGHSAYRRAGPRLLPRLLSSVGGSSSSRRQRPTELFAV